MLNMKGKRPEKAVALGLIMFAAMGFFGAQANGGALDDASIGLTFIVAVICASAYYYMPSVLQTWTEAMSSDEDNKTIAELVTGEEELNIGGEWDAVLAKKRERDKASAAWLEKKRAQRESRKSMEDRLSVRPPASWRELPVGHIWIGYNPETNEPMEMSLRTHWLISGTTGYGKSTLIRVIVSQAIRLGIHVHVVDANLFTDFRVFDGYFLPVDISSDPANEQSREQSARHLLKYMRGLLKEMSDRREAMAGAGVQDIDEIGGYPHLLVVLDEFDGVVSELSRYSEIHDEVMDIFGTVAQRGRKYGIHLLIMVHYPTNEIFSRQVRTQCQSVTFRQTDEYGARHVGYKDAIYLEVGEFAFNGTKHVAWDGSVDAPLLKTIEGIAPFAAQIDRMLRRSTGQHSASTVPAQFHNNPVTVAKQASEQVRTPIAEDAMKVFYQLTSDTYAKKESPTHDDLTPAEIEAARMCYRAGWSQARIVKAFFGETGYNGASVAKVNEAIRDLKG